MTSTPVGLAGRPPRIRGLRPTLWVLGVIVLLGAVLPVIDAATGSRYRTDGSPLGVGHGVQLTPRGGWSVDQGGTAGGETAALVKGATTLTVEVQPSQASLGALWEQLNGKVAELSGVDLVSEPTTVATHDGVPGLSAPLSAPRGGGLAAVYSDGQTAVTAIAQGATYRSQAADVTAMLQSLRFGREEAG